MAASKTTRYLTDIAKDVLQTPERTREQVAWELMSAIRDLFPDRYKELRALGVQLEDEVDYERDDDNQEAEVRFLRGVQDWTSRYGVFCEAMNEAAAKCATGDTPDGGLYLDAHFDDKGHLVFRGTPSITAYPYNETRKEFLKRAGQYYDELASRYADQDGVKRGPVKRNRDHFRYLAAHLVDEKSYADIADKPDEFKVAAASVKKKRDRRRGVERRFRGRDRDRHQPRVWRDVEQRTPTSAGSSPR